MTPLAFLLALLGSGLMTFSSGGGGNTSTAAAPRTLANDMPSTDDEDDTPDTPPVGSSDDTDNTSSNDSSAGATGSTDDSSSDTTGGSTDTTGGSTGTTGTTGSADTPSDDTSSSDDATPNNASSGTNTNSGGNDDPEPTDTGVGSTGTGSGNTNTGDTSTPTNDTTPVAPEQTGGDGEDGAETQSVMLQSQGTTSVMGGRVTTLEPVGNDVESVRILSDVANGNVTVNSDNTMALVMTMSDFTGRQSFTYEVTHSDGSTSTHTGNLNVTQGAQANGWATGESHYMLATDADDKVIVEHGEEHTKVFVSGANSAMSLADIARAEGLNTNQITGEWLANSSYGQSEGEALDLEAGMLLWNQITPRASETSNWLLFERGYEYEDAGRILERDTHGESELNPIYIGAWGEGERPEIQSEFYQWQESSTNVVVQDIHFSGGVFITFGKNWIFDNVKVTEDQAAFQSSEAITVRNSEFTDIVREESKDGGDWDDHSDRIQALFMNRLDGALLEGNFFDYNSWSEDYIIGGDGAGGQTPSMWSHNMYLGADMTDVTMRDTITMRAASYGAQIRAGGFFEDNVFLDNNAAFTTVGGDYKGAGAVGNYTLLADNLVTSAAHKESTYIGAKSLGIKDEARLTSLVDNIVTHLADPDSDELDYKNDTRYSVYSEHGSYYDDTIVYNWKGSENVHNSDIVTEQNTDGLNTNALDQTTIQQFTGQLLGKDSGTIDELAEYIRARTDGQFDGMVDADLIIKFFQEGFGIAPDIRDSASTLRFEPDAAGDGIRWDNRLNWDTDDLPGLYSADDVDLGGNDVVFGTNASVDELDFGPDGSLNVYGGRLDVNGGFTGDEGGALNIEGAGQVWADGSDAENLDITVEGGRFANTGDFSGADLTVTGGEAILASDDGRYTVGSSKTLAVFDSAAKVGFADDDGDMAILDLEEGATVAFKADQNDLGSIEEFSSSAHDSSNVKSGIDLGNSTLSIDLSGLSASNGAAFTLMDADEIVGIFEDAVVGGLGSRNATITVDYESDSVTLTLTSGNGSVNVETVGEETDVDGGEQALWNALTADQGVYSDDAAANQDDDDDMMDAA